MARNLEHFELPKWKQTFPRRRRGGGGSPKRDKQAHGSQLILQADQVANDLQQRTQDAPQGINPKLITPRARRPLPFRHEDEWRVLFWGLGIGAPFPHEKMFTICSCMMNICILTCMV